MYNNVTPINDYHIHFEHYQNNTLMKKTACIGVYATSSTRNVWKVSTNLFCCEVSVIASLLELCSVVSFYTEGSATFI